MASYILSCCLHLFCLTANASLTCVEVALGKLKSVDFALLFTEAEDNHGLEVAFLDESHHRDDVVLRLWKAKAQGKLVSRRERVS